MDAKRLGASIVGWYGAAAIVGAYFLNTFGWMHADSLGYQLLNLTGAIGIVIEATSKRDQPSAVLNVIWSVIALVAIISILRH